ncbi:tyrosinase family oxidase copper chaperone [Streptomyces sp. NPDC002018]|uniref:tyrosinase family oxidase copper chaperone n=1 Tax=Streptomyces sp. NPDC002018 TaxID=3364629 RepID=UPI0036A62E4A
MEPRPVRVRNPEPTAATPESAPEPVPAEEPSPSGRVRARRPLLRVMFTLGVVTGTSAVLAPVLRAGHRAAGGTGGGAEASGGEVAATGGTIEEMYRGRHIRIGVAGSPHPPSGTRTHTASSAPAVPVASSAAAPEIRIDGRPLEVMRRADGSYLSVVNHYESFPTLLEAARAAVDDLAGAELSLSGPIHHIRGPIRHI